MISGKAGSGKDFLGDILEKRGCRRSAFADQLKYITSKIYGIPLQDLNTQQGKKKMYHDKTYRQILIEESTRYKKEDKYFFARPVIDRFKISNTSKNGVITDFRFPEEFEYAKKELAGIYDVKTILIKRDAHIQVDDTSERALDIGFYFDYVLDNNGSIHDLKNQLFIFNL